MNPHIDYAFRRECAAFVYMQLGASSDDAAACFACSECGQRFGHVEPTAQMNMTYCCKCGSECEPTPVDAIQPAWTTPSLKIVKNSPDDEESEDDGLRLGRRLYELSAAIMQDRGASRLNGRHVDIAIASLHKEGVKHGPEELRALRKRYRDKIYKQSRVKPQYDKTKEQV